MFTKSSWMHFSFWAPLLFHCWYRLEDGSCDSKRPNRIEKKVNITIKNYARLTIFHHSAGFHLWDELFIFPSSLSMSFNHVIQGREVSIREMRVCCWIRRFCRNIAGEHLTRAFWGWQVHFSSLIIKALCHGDQIWEQMVFQIERSCTFQAVFI